MPTMPEPILEINDFCVDFKTENGHHRVVDHLSFQLQRGKTLGIVGESGSGKSVTALSIMRLLKTPLYSGHIYFKENKGKATDLLQLSNTALRSFRGKRIGMIFQEPMTSLNPSMRCGTQISEVMQLHLNLSKQQAKQRSMQLLEEVLLPDPEKIYNAFPHEISGGQKQRVMIAMAICCNPDIVIADEPTTALDVTVQKTILELLRNLQAKYNISILFITHDLGVVAAIAHTAIVMYKGKKVEEAPVANLFKNPQHPYTQGLLACRVPLHMRYDTLPTVSSFMASQEANHPPQPKPRIIVASEWKDKSKTLYQQDALLKIYDLYKSYPLPKKFGKKRHYFHALDQINFELYEGETLGLVGESGCGKTTLGRSILRLTDIDKGKIIYQGKDIAQLAPSQMRPLRKDMQIIFQDPYSSLNPRYTVGMAIMEPMKLHGILHSDSERKSYVMDLLRKVHLEEKHFYAYPHEFSGGQRQRICIARALALQPKIIVCDESVSALDVSVQAQVLNLLNALKAEFNITYIFISHDLSVVKFMSDRIIVMKNGKIQEMNLADEVYEHPQSEYTKHLIQAIPRLD